MLVDFYNLYLSYLMCMKIKKGTRLLKTFETLSMFFNPWP